MAKAIEVKKAPAAVKVVKDAGEKKEKKAALPFGKKMSGLALKTRQRLEKAFKKVSASDMAELVGIKTALDNAVQSLDAVSTQFAALPDAFTMKGGKSTGGGSKVEVGALVAIKAKRKAEYEGLLDEAELVSLTVVTVKGSKLVLKTASGNKIFMPKAHVEAVKSEAKAA